MGKSAYVHYQGPYSPRTRCGRTPAMRPQTTEHWSRVTCPRCNELHAMDVKRSVEAGDLELPHGNDMVGTAIRHPVKKEAALRITLGEVRRVVRDVLREGGYESEAFGAGFMLVDPDGRRYHADPTRVRRWLIQNTKMSGSERDAVMSTGEVTAGVLARLKRDHIISDRSIDRPVPKEPKRNRPSYFETLRRSAEREKDRLFRDRQKAGKAYARAVKDFARTWEDPEPGIVPEDAASDAALNFFALYQNEWPEWARLLDMRKDDIQSNIADYVYDAMTKPKKARRPSHRKVPDQMVDIDSIAPVEGPGGRRSR